MELELFQVFLIVGLMAMIYTFFLWIANKPPKKKK